MGFPGFRLPPPLPTATATPPLQSLPCLQLLTEFSKNKQIVLRLFQGLREFCIYFNFASEKHNQPSLVFLQDVPHTSILLRLHMCYHRADLGAFVGRLELYGRVFFCIDAEDFVGKGLAYEVYFLKIQNDGCKFFHAGQKPPCL